jgi:hypothetical protein
MILYDVVCIHHQIILVHIIYSKTSILYIHYESSDMIRKKVAEALIRQELLVPVSCTGS